MIVQNDLVIQPRSSGKTASLKLKAIELHQQYYKVIFMSFNEKSTKDIKQYFINISMNIECTTIQKFSTKFVQNNKKMPPEYLLVNNGEIYILLDEYNMMDKNKLDRLFNDLTVSPHEFVIIGRTS